MFRDLSKVWKTWSKNTILIMTNRNSSEFMKESGKCVTRCIIQWISSMWFSRPESRTFSDLKKIIWQLWKKYLKSETRFMLNIQDKDIPLYRKIVSPVEVKFRSKVTFQLKNLAETIKTICVFNKYSGRILWKKKWTLTCKNWEKK